MDITQVHRPRIRQVEELILEVNIKEIKGNWTLGYSLDKHTIRSTPTGYNEYGHLQFETERSEAGEALYQLKYKSDYSQIPIIAEELYDSLSDEFSSAGLIIPMPPSKQRSRQPVLEIASELADLMGIPYMENLLVKTGQTPAMKDIGTREGKISALMGAFTVYDVLEGGLYDVLIIDDLFDTGSSLEAATNMLLDYEKIHDIYVATVTRKR